MNTIPKTPNRHDPGELRPDPDEVASEVISIPIASPTDVNLALDALEQADRLLATEQVGVYSLLVCRHGKLVFERYYHNDDVRSVTKSVVSLVIGCVIDDGLLGLTDTLRELMPERLPSEGASQVGEITIANLLSMTAGFEWDDLGDFMRLVSSDDWVDAVLHAPLAAAPGTMFTYNSGCSQILSEIVRRTTGRHVAELAAERLFRPMGIAAEAWPTDPQGHSIGGFGLQLRSRDMVKLGLLVLREGQWDEQRLVPADFVRAATSRQSDGGFPEGTPYGYHWWTTEIDNYRVSFAAGYGGQYICVVRDLDLVLVTTAFWQGSPDDLSDPIPAIRMIVESASSRDSGRGREDIHSAAPR
jgi:CubicO group peptidase (beta-lactamase class C family)